MPVAPKKAAAQPEEKKSSYFAGAGDQKTIPYRNYIKKGEYKVRVRKAFIVESDKVFFCVKTKVLELLTSDTEGRVGEEFDFAMDLTTKQKDGFCYGLKDAKLFGAAIAPEEIDPDSVDSEYLDGVLEHDFEEEPVDIVVRGVPATDEDGNPKLDSRKRPIVNGRFERLT